VRRSKRLPNEAEKATLIMLGWTKYTCDCSPACRLMWQRPDDSDFGPWHKILDGTNLTGM
jgi:hypothetical protein